MIGTVVIDEVVCIIESITLAAASIVIEAYADHVHATVRARGDVVVFAPDGTVVARAWPDPASEPVVVDNVGMHYRFRLAVLEVREWTGDA